MIGRWYVRVEAHVSSPCRLSESSTGVTPGSPPNPVTYRAPADSSTTTRTFRTPAARALTPIGEAGTRGRAPAGRKSPGPKRLGRASSVGCRLAVITEATKDTTGLARYAGGKRRGSFQKRRAGERTPRAQRLQARMRALHLGADSPIAAPLRQAPQTSSSTMSREGYRAFPNRETSGHGSRCERQGCEESASNTATGSSPDVPAWLRR